MSSIVIMLNPDGHMFFMVILSISVIYYSFTFFFFFFKQKTAYELRISDWSSDVCSSDLRQRQPNHSWLAKRGRSETWRPATPRRRGRRHQRAARATRAGDFWARETIGWSRRRE